MVQLLLGYGIPILLAPFLVYLLKYPFAIFLREGGELFGDRFLPNRDAEEISSQLALINVIILLVTWLTVFSCAYFNVAMDWRTLLALGGIIAALLVTVLVVHLTLGLEGWVLWGVGMISFTGGNLPLILIVPLLLFFL